MGDGIVGKLDWSFSIFHGTGKSTSTTGRNKESQSWFQLSIAVPTVGLEGVPAKNQICECQKNELTFSELFVKYLYRVSRVLQNALRYRLPQPASAEPYSGHGRVESEV